MKMVIAKMQKQWRDDLVKALTAKTKEAIENKKEEVVVPDFHADVKESEGLLGKIIKGGV